MKLSDYLAKHYTKETAKIYEREIRNYLANQPNAKNALYKDVTNYLNTLRKRYRNPQTLNRILSSIKVYYDYLNATGKRSDHPARLIRLRDKRSHDIQLQDLFTMQELESLLKRKERYPLLTQRNQVLLSLLIYQAPLPQELASLTTNDINLNKGTIQIQATAKTNARTLHLKANQVMLLHEYLEKARPELLGEKETKALLISKRGNGLSVDSLISHFKTNYKDLFPNRSLNMRTIRQSVIANLLKAGHDLRVVQHFAGHKYPGSTEKYKQSDVEALQRAIDKHHPMG